VLFASCLLTVAHILPYGVTLVFVCAVVLWLDKSVFGKIDYGLLLTFVFFFIIVGNMGRIPAFNRWLQSIIDGNEVLTGVVISQFMSNVPAALLLSGFTKRYDLLIVGTNLGGLGTIIASMASLISFKYIGKDYKHLRGRYLVYFTVANILFLTVLLGYFIVFCG
ncbi:MAG: citrate transporter, partial [Lachnospiraceae bacterium]|nr:citrate transporter [Lachnospiraceae bacterium]